MVTLFVPDLPEFAALVEASRNTPGCNIQPPHQGYWRIEADRELRFNRKTMGLKPALWYSALSGGFKGHILEYGRDELRIGSEAS